MTNPINESRDVSGKANLSGGNTFNWNQTINGWLNIDSTTWVLIVPRMTETERNALSWVNNWSIIFNTSTQVFNIYQWWQWDFLVLGQQNQTIEWNKTFTWNTVFNSRVTINTTTGTLTIPRLSTAERDALSEVAWALLYNNSVNFLQYRDNISWKSIIDSNKDQTIWWQKYFSSPVIPLNDNSISCWTTSNRFTSIWAANGTIQTSDEREKTDIKETELWLDFINKLNPVSYKWKVGWNEVNYEEIEVEKEVQETVEEIQKIETIEEINGKFVKVIKEEKIQIPVYDEVDLYNEAWEIIWKHQIPKMIKKIVTEKKEIVTQKLWKRNHFWLLAQEVEEALNWVDFWGLVIDENWKYALRYDQFISPLIKAVQELSARVKELENK